MMSFMHFTCPSCGRNFPFFPGFSKSRIRTGYFSAPRLQCQSCGLVFRQTVSWVNALWAWPLTLLVLALVIWTLHTIPFFVELHRDVSWLFGGIGGGLAGLIAGLGLRPSLRFVPLSEEVGPVPSRMHRGWLVGVAILAIVVAIGFTTERWLHIGIGLAAGIGVWLLFYVRASKRE